jgi:putative membrane-bound dehydrogenase-like protein
VGRIVMLEDTDGDGRMDKVTVFADGLTFPNGVFPWKGGLIVTCSPDVLYLKDTKGTGKADVTKVLLTGFSTKGSTQLRVNRPTLGPDGWIYFAAGLSTGEITSPEHPEMPLVKMTGDLRWNPETGEFQNVDGRCQYGMSFDDYGRRFICMNRIQVQHMVLTSAYLKRNPLFAFSDTIQNCPDLIPNKLLGNGLNGAARLYPISSNITTADSHAGTFTAACAVHIWRGGALPPEYRGCAFSCDPTGNLVHVDKLAPRGATYAATPLLPEREPLAFKDDWARPVFVDSGPDGGMYVCDMYRRVIEHPDYLSEEIRKHTDFESGKNMGRIWRVSAAGSPKASFKFPALDLSTPAGNRQAAALVAQANGWQAETAFRLLAERRAPNAAGALHEALQGEIPAPGRASLLNLLALDGGLTGNDLEQAFKTGQPGVCETALVLSEAKPEWIAQARKLAPSLPDDVRVRFQEALSLTDDGSDQSLGLLASILAASDSDRWTEAAVLSACPKRTLALLQRVQQLPGKRAFTSGFFDSAGRLIGVGKECTDTATLAAELAGLGPELGGVVAGFCEVTHAKLDATLPTLAKLIEAARAELAQAKSEAASNAQLGAVAILSHAPWESAHEPLERAAFSKTQPELSQAAMRALANFDSPEVAATFLTKQRWTTYTPAEREGVLGALLPRAAHHAGVLTAIESGNVPASAIPTLRRAVFLKSKDAAVRERAEKLFAAANGDRQKAYEAEKAVLVMNPNAEHGATVFHNICSICHRLNRDGHAVGPDLLDIRSQTKENILFHIVIPDAEIAPAFTAYSAETKDGRTFVGILASETPTSVTLRMPLAQEENILRSNLNALNALPNSLMPTGLEGAMSKQDMADLLAFLKGEK